MSDKKELLMLKLMNAKTEKEVLYVQMKAAYAELEYWQRKLAPPNITKEERK